MFAVVLYTSAMVLLVASCRKDMEKTKKALRKAWKAFENILPQLVSIILIIGMSLAFLDEAIISKLLGEQSGVAGLLVAAVVGSIAFMPSFVAYPLAASLLNAGAGYAQITMFITALMMVGVITLPLEMKHFGRDVAIRRTVLALVHSVLCALFMGAVMG